MASDLEKSAASYSMEEFAEDGEGEAVSEVLSEQIDEDISEGVSEEEDYSQSFAQGSADAASRGRGSEEQEGSFSASEDVGASSASASAPAPVAAPVGITAAPVGITATSSHVEKEAGASAVPSVTSAPVGLAIPSSYVPDTSLSIPEEDSQGSYEEDFAESAVDQSRSESKDETSASQSVSARTSERRRLAEEEQQARMSEEQDMRSRIEQRRRQIAEQQQQQQQQEVRMPSVQEEDGQSFSPQPKVDASDAKSGDSEVSDLDEDVDEIIEESDEEEMQSRQSSEKEAQQNSWEEAQRKADAEMMRQAEEAKTNQEAALAEAETRRKVEEEAQRTAEEEARCRTEEERSRRREEEARHKREQEEKRKAQEDADRLAEEEAKRVAEEEAKRVAEEEAKREAEDKAKREAEEAAARKAEEEAARRAEEEAVFKAEEEARCRAEEEARCRAEEEARFKAEEAEATRKAEEEAKYKAEESARRKAEEEARHQAEEEAKCEAEKEARLKAEEEMRRKDEEAQRQLEDKVESKSDEQATQDGWQKADQEAREDIVMNAKSEAAKHDAKKAAEDATDATHRDRPAQMSPQKEDRHVPVETRADEGGMQNAARDTIQVNIEDASEFETSKLHEDNGQADIIRDETVPVDALVAPLDIELSMKPKRKLGKAQAAPSPKLGKANASPLPSGRDALKTDSSRASSFREGRTVMTSEVVPQPLTVAGASHLPDQKHGDIEAIDWHQKQSKEGSSSQMPAGKLTPKDDKENRYTQLQGICSSSVSFGETPGALKADITGSQAEEKVRAHDQLTLPNQAWRPVAESSTQDSSCDPNHETRERIEPVSTGINRSSSSALVQDFQEKIAQSQYNSDQRWAHSDSSLRDYGKQDGHSSWWTSQNQWWNKSPEGWNWTYSQWKPVDNVDWHASNAGRAGIDFYQDVPWRSQPRGRSEERYQDWEQTGYKRTWWEEKASYNPTRQREHPIFPSSWDLSSGFRNHSSSDAYLGAESSKRLVTPLRQAFKESVRDSFFAAGWDPDALYRQPDAKGAWLHDPQARGSRIEPDLLKQFGSDSLSHNQVPPRVVQLQSAANTESANKLERERQHEFVADSSASGPGPTPVEKPAAASLPEVQLQSKGTSTDVDAWIMGQAQSSQARESSLLQADLINGGDLSPQEFGKFALQAIGEVAHDLLELKYHSGLDVDEFVETGARACGEYALLSMQRLLEKINSQSQLRFLDRRREQLLHLRLDWRVLSDFDSLRRTVRLVPGTASAVAVITIGGGHVLDVVAVFRIAYTDSGMVVGRSGRGGSQPLRHFGDVDLCGAVAIDPVIVSMCSVNATPQNRLSGIIPATVPEYVSLESLLHDGFKKSAAMPSNSTAHVPQSLLAVMHALAPTAEVLQKVVDVLERPDLEPESVLVVLGKLVEWLKHEPQATLVRRGLAASKGHAGLVTVLRRHRSQCSFAASALRVIGWTSRHHVENAVVFVDCDAVKEVLSVLEMHRADKEVHRHGLYAIGCLAHYGGGASQAIGAGALGIVHRSMAIHRDSPSVQINGCEVLRCLAESGDAPVEDLGRVALDAKRAFPRDQTVHRAADALLAFVVPRTVCTITMLMDTQQSDAEIQNSGSRTLGQLAEYGGVAWRGAAAGAVSRISRALANHRENVSLQAVGLWALGRLAERVEAPCAGMYDAATRAKAKHSGSALVQRYADQLLAYLSSRP